MQAFNFQINLVGRERLEHSTIGLKVQCSTYNNNRINKELQWKMGWQFYNV